MSRFLLYHIRCSAFIWFILVAETISPELRLEKLPNTTEGNILAPQRRPRFALIWLRNVCYICTCAACLCPGGVRERDSEAQRRSEGDGRGGLRLQRADPAAAVHHADGLRHCQRSVTEGLESVTGGYRSFLLEFRLANKKKTEQNLVVNVICLYEVWQ